eukprot:gene6763-8388_t
MVDRGELIHFPKGSIPAVVKLELTIANSNIVKQNQLQELHIDRYKDTLVNGSIPMTVIWLKISHELFKHDPHQIIPESVHYLVISNCSFEGGLVVPQTVKSLFFTDTPFIGLSEGSFPSNMVLKHLEIGNCIEKIPKIDSHVLPKSIKKLVLLSYFETPLENGSIPDSVEELHFGYKYKHNLPPGVLPEGIKKIHFGFRFGSDLVIGSIPSTVTFMSFTDLVWYPVCREGVLPPTLKYLEVSETQSATTYLPPSLETLVCDFDFITIGFLPPNLKYIQLNSRVLKIEPGAIPPSVTRVGFADIKDPIILDGVLPNSIKELSLTIPDSLIPFPVIPQSVENLSLNILKNRSANVSYPIPIGSIPESVQDLKINFPPNYSLPMGLLPSNLKILRLGTNIRITNAKLFYLPLSINSLIINPPPTNKDSNVEDAAEFFIFISNLLNESRDSQFRIIFPHTHLTIASIDKMDPYIYFFNDYHLAEGFLLKSNIISDLPKLILNCKKNNCN